MIGQEGNAMSTHSRRLAVFAAAFAAAGFAFAGVPATAAERYTLMLDWLPSGDKAPAYVALQKGYFAEEGLEIGIQNGRGSTDALTKAATGTADFATGGLPALMSAAAQSGIPVKAIISVYTKQPDSLFVVKGGAIKTLKDVVGRKVATATFNSSNALWPLFLQRNNIEPNSVVLQKVDPTVLSAMLASGQVDATLSWMTVAPTYASVLSQAGKQLTVLPWSEFGLDGYGFAVFASDRVIKSNPKAVAAFARAMRKAIDFSVANPEAAGAAVHAAAATVDLPVATDSFKASIPLIKNEISAKDGLGVFEPALLKKTWEWVALSENYPADRINPETLVDRSFRSTN
jgi:NitT/TauT family transport system substrate-binding protein